MSQKITAGKVAGFTYILTDDEGTILDQSDRPLFYLHGSHNLIPGLERALEGVRKGEQKKIDVLAADAYGEYNEDLVQTVPKEMFPEGMKIERGMQFQVDTPDGAIMLYVQEIQDDGIVVNGNPPLAGENLHFDVTIVLIRDATQEELDRGSVISDPS